MWADIPEDVKADVSNRAWGQDTSSPTGSMRINKITQLQDGRWVDLEIRIVRKICSRTMDDTTFCVRCLTMGV